MTEKYTPGPWVIAEDTPFVYALNDKGYNRFWLSCQSPNCGQSDDEFVAGVDELEANARLISCAPELLEALENMLVQFNEQMPGIVHDEWAAITKARSIIAKAKGE